MKIHIKKAWPMSFSVMVFLTIIKHTVSCTINVITDQDYSRSVLYSNCVSVEGVTRRCFQLETNCISTTI